MSRVCARGAAALALLCALVCALPASIEGQRSAPAPTTFTTRHGGPRMRVTGRVHTGILPKSVRVSPDGTRVVVCNFGRPDIETLAVFDARTLERTGTLDFPGNAVEAVFTPDGHTLFVSNFRRGVVEVIDFASLELRGEIEVGRHPKWMSLSPDAQTLYVANYADANVSVVDIHGDDVSAYHETHRLPTLRQPRGMAVLPDGMLLAAAFRGDVIHRFGAGAREEDERWETCQMPRHLTLSPDALTAYLTCSMGSIHFIDAASGRRFGLAPTGRNPRSIDLSGDGRWLGVANFSSNDVSLIDTVEHTHRRTEIERARGVVGLAMHPGPELRMYATSWETGELIMLEPTRPVASAAVAQPADDADGEARE